MTHFSLRSTDIDQSVLRASKMDHQEAQKGIDTERQTDRQTDKQTDRQINKQKNRQVDRQTSSVI